MKPLVEELHRVRTLLKLYHASYVVIDKQQQIQEYEGTFDVWPLLAKPVSNGSLVWREEAQRQLLQQYLDRDHEYWAYKSIFDSEQLTLPAGGKVIIRPVLNEKEQWLYLIGYQPDLTEATSTPTGSKPFDKNEYHRYQERMRYITRATSDGFYDVDIKQQKIWRTDNFYTIFGYTPTAETQDFWWWEQMIHPDDRQEVLGSMQEIFDKRGDFWTAEYRFRTAEGAYAIALDRANILYDHGQPSRLIGAIKDLTEQKVAAERAHQAERTLRNERLLLLTVTHNIREAIYRIEPNKGMVYVNKAFADVFGFQDTKQVLDLDSEALNDLYFQIEERREMNREVHQHGQVRNREILFRRRDGSVFWGLESCIIHHNSDGSVYIDGTVTNIHELRTAREELEAKNDELQKINAELDRFVYSASHDLRAPLSSLMGLLNLIELDEDKERIDSYHAKMHQQINRMDEFIREIITYSRNSRQEINPSPIELTQLAKEAWNQFGYLPGAEEMQLEMLSHGDYLFCSDLARVRVLFNNMISNAIRYRDANKVTCFLKISINKGPSLVEISFEDNGLGIEEQYQGSVFDMFFRASDSSDGSGLGLYIVKETLDKLNGTVSLISELGKGTCFTLSLPNLTELQRVR